MVRLLLGGNRARAAALGAIVARFRGLNAASVRTGLAIGLGLGAATRDFGLGLRVGRKRETSDEHRENGEYSERFG